MAEKYNHVSHLSLPISTSTDGRIKLSSLHTRGIVQCLSIGRCSSYSSHTRVFLLYAALAQGKIDGDSDAPLPPSPGSTLANFQLSQSEGSVTFIVKCNLYQFLFLVEN